MSCPSLLVSNVCECNVLITNSDNKNTSVESLLLIIAEIAKYSVT